MSVELTVLCTVFNGAKYFEKAVPSILNQTFLDFEFLIVDDGSTDGTSEFLEAVAKSDGRVRVLRPGRLGRVAALNYGLSQCTTDLVANQDFDDASVPNRLQIQLDAMRRMPEVTWLGGASLAKSERFEEEIIKYFPTEHDAIVRAMSHSIPFDHTCVMYRRTSILEAGGYPPNGGVEDFRLAIEVARRGGRFANLSDVLGDHTEYLDSYWNANFSVATRQRAVRDAQLLAIKSLPLPRWRYVYPIGRTFYHRLPRRIQRMLWNFTR